jgi:tetratricopeptide (TPR) repeat protein
VGHLRRAAAGGDEHRVRLCDYAERAARAARQVGAFADAARYYEWAYEAASALEQPDSHKRAELLVAVGRAQQVAGQVGTARRTFAQAVELAERYGFAELLVNIGQHLRPTFMWASLPDVLAQRALEAALRLAPSNDTRLRALILARLSCTPPHSLGPDHGRVLSRQAVELARSSGNHDAIVDALRSCLASCTGPDDTSSLLAATDELLGLEGQGQRSWAVAEAQLARNLAFFHRGDVERADAALDEYGRMTERLGIAESMFHYERMRLQRRMQQGHYAEARRGSEALWVSAERMELRYAVFFRAMGELELIYELEGAATVLENPALWGALTQWSTLNEYHRAIMIQIACDGGRPEFGRPALEELAAAGFSTITRDLQYLSTLAHLAGAVVRIGDRDKAQALFDLLAPYAHMNTTNFYCSTLGSVAHFVGELAVLLGRAAEATGFLQQAGTRNTEMRLCLCTLRSKLALARHLGDARSPRDRAQVARLLEEVRTEATRLGATSLLKQLS